MTFVEGKRNEEVVTTIPKKLYTKLKKKLQTTAIGMRKTLKLC